MGCTLVARGKDFDVKDFLARTRLPIKDAHFWIRGTPIYRKKRFHHDSGFSEWVSVNRWDDLSAAVTEVMTFLRKHKRELAKLMRTNGVGEILLDFAFNSRVGTPSVAMQGEYLPTELLRLAGDLNIGIALSIYPPFGEKPANRKNASSVKNTFTNKEFKQWLQRQDKPAGKAGRSRTAKRA